MNKVCEQMWAVKFADLQGTDGSQYFPPDQMALILAKDQEVFAGGGQVDFEETIWNATLKQNHTYHTFKKPVYDPSGKPINLIGVSIDITDWKKIDAELRIAAVAFESHESLMITDANKVILRVNQAFIEETGYTAEEAVGQTPKLLSSGAQDSDFYRVMWEVVNRTGKWRGEIWDRRKNGEIYQKMADHFRR